MKFLGKELNPRKLIMSKVPKSDGLEETANNVKEKSEKALEAHDEAVREIRSVESISRERQKA